MNNEVCLYGSGGHSKVIKDIIMDQGKKVVAFFDDNPKLNTINETPVLKSNLLKEYKGNPLFICIGDNTVRKEISGKLNFNFITLIHSKSCVSDSVIIKSGTVVMPNAIINSDSIIGKQVIVNTSAVIEHDCIIEDYVHISPNVTLTGGVKVKEGAHIGAGTVVIPGVEIGKWAIIGAGSVIIKNIPDYAIVVGNPGRIIKYNKDKNE